MGHLHQFPNHQNAVGGWLHALFGQKLLQFVVGHGMWEIRRGGSIIIIGGCYGLYAFDLFLQTSFLFFQRKYPLEKQKVPLLKQEVPLLKQEIPLVTTQVKVVRSCHKNTVATDKTKT